jgi:hypothetical protein
MVPPVVRGRAGVPRKVRISLLGRVGVAGFACV